MEKDKNILTVRNVTDHQYGWVIREAKRLGVNLTAIVKILIEDKMKKGN